MHVVERGSGTPLVLLHGFGVDHRLLLPLDSIFEADGGWRRIYVDLPATSGTPIDDVASADDVATVTEAEIRDRVGTDSFAIVGNSFGGMIARQLAHTLRPQVLGLATLAGVFVADHARRTLPPKSILVEDPAALDALGPAAADYAAVSVVQSTENAAAFRDHVYPGLISADQVGLDRIATRYALAHEPEEFSPEPFDQPSLFITGRQDHIVGFSDAWARMEHYPRATFVTLDAAGHNTHLDQPAITAALLLDWLDRVTRAR